MPKDRRIAPFTFEEIEENRGKALWSDIAEAARKLRQSQKREIPEHLDVRTAGFWFEEMNVLWNGDTIDAYVEDSEGSPWVVEWTIGLPHQTNDDEDSNE